MPTSTPINDIVLIDESSDGWSTEQEQVLKTWAEKSWSLAWMHNKAAKEFRELNAKVQIPTIVLNTVSGLAGFAIINSSLYIGTIFLSIIGVINVFNAVLVSIANFLKSGESAESHFHASTHYAALYRKINVELSLISKNRIPCDEFITSCKNEYDRLINNSPQIPEAIVKIYLKIFSDFANKPDIAQSKIVTADTIALNKLFEKRESFAHSIYENIDETHHSRPSTDSPSPLPQFDLSKLASFNSSNF